MLGLTHLLLPSPRSAPSFPDLRHPRFLPPPSRWSRTDHAVDGMVSVEGSAPRSPRPTSRSVRGDGLLNKPRASVLHNLRGAFALASSLLCAVGWGGGFSSVLEMGSRSAERLKALSWLGHSWSGVTTCPIQNRLLPYI